MIRATGSFRSAPLGRSTLFSPRAGLIGRTTNVSAVAKRLTRSAHLNARSTRAFGSGLATGATRSRIDAGTSTAGPVAELITVADIFTIGESAIDTGIAARRNAGIVLPPIGAGAKHGRVVTAAEWSGSAVHKAVAASVPGRTTRVTRVLRRRLATERFFHEITKVIGRTAETGGETKTADAVTPCRARRRALPIGTDQITAGYARFLAPTFTIAGERDQCLAVSGAD